VGKYYYLMSLLPPLPESLGDQLPEGLDRLAQLARRNVEPDDSELLDLLLSQADILNYINHRTGRDVFMPGGFISQQDLEGNKNISQDIAEFLRQPEANRPYAYDRLWEIYLTRALQTAEKRDNVFLKKYLLWETQLRNALTILRAGQAGLEKSSYLVAVGVETYDMGPVISGLKECSGPLEAELFLNRERLKFAAGCLNYDRFSLDALLGYLTQAMIFWRWKNLNKPYDLNKITIAGGIK
jgi:hypothetical protein